MNESATTSAAPSRCLSCRAESQTSLSIPDQGQPTRWHFCRCGSIFHPAPIDSAVFRNGYYDRLLATITHGDLEERYEHLRRCYLPLIEEVVWGRRFLEVGFLIPSHLEALRTRGWVTKGIELSKVNGQLHGNFETYEFRLPPEARYDLIWMGHVLQCFNTPIETLAKAYGLLKPGGGLFVSTPDAEQVWDTGVTEYGHWNPKEMHVFFSERELVRQLTWLGFDVVFRIKNRSRRFLNWHDLHLLALKPHDAD